MVTVYDSKAVKANYRLKSRLHVSKYLPQFGKEVVGFTPEDDPCIIVTITDIPFVLSDCRKTSGKNIFMQDSFVEALDKLVDKVCKENNVLVQSFAGGNSN